MNDNNLDARLRAASDPEPVSFDDSMAHRATTSRRRPLARLLYTTTPASRRSVGGALAAVAVTALALPAVFPAQSPLFSLASAGGQTMNSMNSMNADVAGSESKMSMMPFIQYNYLADPELSRTAGSGMVYRFKLEGEPRSRAEEIAAELGLNETATKSTYFDPAFPSWVVGPEDGTAPSVSLYWSGTGSWWYNNPAAYPLQECTDPGQPGDVDGDENSELCAEYAAPTSGLNPSEGEASAIAEELFERLGFDGDPADFTVYRDEWGTTVSASEEVEGTRVAVDWSINWSGNGEIAFVSGHSATVVEAGTFATVSAADAVDRLNDWRWFGAAPMDGVPWMSARAYDAVDSGEPLPTESVDTEPSPTESVEPGLEPEPLPTESVEPGLEPEPTPTVMDMIISVAKPQLLMVWDNNGGAWLVPGFVMQGIEGWPLAVISLIEGVIELPDPMPIEPAIVD